MKYKWISLFFLFHACFANNSDANEPLFAQSDTAQLDQKKLTGEYQGHVHATQGKTQLEADKVRVQLNTQHKVESVQAFGTPQTPAIYTTLLKAKNKPLYASAQEIDYNVSQSLVTLKGNAIVKQNSDTYAADLIYYDTQKKIVRSPENEQKQIKIVIHPTSTK